jgi:hypothetical protein
MAIKYTYQMAAKHTKWTRNLPTSSIASKICPNLDFGFENIPSGNPAAVEQKKRK